MFPFKSVCTGVNAADPRRSGERYEKKVEYHFDLRTKQTQEALTGLQEIESIDASVGDRNVRKRLNNNQTIPVLSANQLHKP